MRTIHVPPWLITALLLAACGSAGTSPPGSSGDPFDPQGAWQLESGTSNGAAIPLVDGHTVSLTIEGSEIGGTAACNHYGGRLTVTGGRIEIGDLAMTAMGCEDPLMAAESAFVAALSEVETIGGDAGQLVLRGPQVELRFDALAPPPTAELVDTVWVLDTLFVGDVASSPSGDLATLELRADGTFVGSTGCRTFSGDWLEQGGQIVAPSFAMDQTECPAELSQQDGHVLTVIGDGFVPSVEGDLLTLVDPGGVGLVYRAEK
jgi:heat shock protein HslJ